VVQEPFTLFFPFILRPLLRKGLVVWFLLPLHQQLGVFETVQSFFADVVCTVHTGRARTILNIDVSCETQHQRGFLRSSRQSHMELLLTICLFSLTA